MKIKVLLRFYFAADGIEKHLNGLILKYACNPLCGAEYGADRICGLIEEKKELCKLWTYLDGIIRGLNESERGELEKYSCMRTGLKLLKAEEVKAVRRAVIKFVRHAHRLNKFERQIDVLKRYYCLTCRGGNSGRACP